MSDYGIKIAVSGHNVEDAENQNLVYSSQYEALKIVEMFTIDFLKTTADLVSQEQKYRHGLGFAPMVMGVAEYWIPGGTSPSYRSKMPILSEGGEVTVSADSQYVYVKFADLQGARVIGTIYVFGTPVGVA